MLTSYFFILFGYSLLRSVTTALYLQTFGAAETPLMSFLSVFVLLATVTVLNRLQKNYSIQSLFTLLSILSCFIFLGAFECLDRGIRPCAHVLFIWKEVYIVFLIHMCWGYLNNLLKETAAKYLFGYIAAAGSIGGIAGGLLPSVLTHSFGARGVILAGVTQLALTAFLFSRTTRLSIGTPKAEKPRTPIESLSGVRPYVLYIAALVILSQFCIGIIDLKFNLQFQSAVPDVTQKVNRLGYVFASINAVALISKLLLLPVLFSITSNQRVQFLIPSVYLVLSLFGLGLGSPVLWVVALSFVLVKGIDYSAFTVSKELLYYPLRPEQKYGAKYVVDMFAYRFAKAVISFVLIFMQKPMFLNGLLSLCLSLWIILVIRFGFRPVRVENSLAVSAMDSARL